VTLEFVRGLRSAFRGCVAFGSVSDTATLNHELIWDGLLFCRHSSLYVDHIKFNIFSPNDNNQEKKTKSGFASTDAGFNATVRFKKIKMYTNTI